MKLSNNIFRYLFYAVFLWSYSLSADASLLTIVFDVTITSSSFNNYNSNIFSRNTDIGYETISINYETDLDTGFSLIGDTFVDKINNPTWSTTFDNKMLPQFVGKNSNNNSIGASHYIYSVLGSSMGGSKSSKTLNDTPDIIPSRSFWDSSAKENSITISSFYQNPINGYYENDVQVNSSFDLKENFINNMIFGTTFGVTVISEDYSTFRKFNANGVPSEVFYTGERYKWTGTAIIKNIGFVPVPIPSAIWLFLGVLGTYTITRFCCINNT